MERYKSNSNGFRTGQQAHTMKLLLLLLMMIMMKKYVTSKNMCLVIYNLTLTSLFGKFSFYFYIV